ncbi:gfo/Idh/MocA family oxidoreductase [Microbacterium bovistercoris]|uniref:Gfo/Idh/MocA family oxidoreductase n=1 Tax=Microbacterium bovistercoris TaxID=2293570 RepID=A0A371NXK8_9MICO|nr:Gfo/Idh/MocA family oxidoreductase [Microbacterium bovistercoris]REJ07481.1 gfo/Idh/MocA family oxidoreductase [Microbacterium bovistercoris]
MTFTFDPLPTPVVDPGEFVFAAVGLDHGHIFGMVEGLIGAGGTLSLVHDSDPERAAAFAARYPGARVAASEQEVLEDRDVRLVASAAIAGDRAPLGVRVLDAGKDFFSDKPAITSSAQLAAARAAVERTGGIFAVYYGERLQSEAALLAGQLIDQGAIGRVLQVASFGPHRVGTGRPDWFFEPDRYGGILCDIGSHNFEQMLQFTGATGGEIVSATVANYAHPETPGLQDFGDAHVVLDNGTTGYVRVDWFTPDGLGMWGDGRTLILGADGYIELRKYIDITTDNGGDQVLLVNQDGQYRFDAAGKTGFPYFGRLIRDCLDRTETAMTQEHAFMAAELSIRAQEQARVLAGMATAVGPVR